MFYTAMTMILVKKSGVGRDCLVWGEGGGSERNIVMYRVM